MILLCLQFTLCFNHVTVKASGQTWLGTWAYCLPYTVNGSLIDEELINFPVYINLTNSNVFGVIGENYYKMAIADENASLAYVEIVSWNSTANQAELWACLNLTISVDSPFYLYFDNNQLPNTDYVGTQNSLVGSHVWDSYFKVVDHLNNYGDTGHTADSTSNNNDGSKKGAGEPLESTGKIGLGQVLDGTDDKITYTDNASLDVTGAFTLEAWIKSSDGLDEEATGFYGGVEKSAAYRIGWQGWTDGWTLQFYNATANKSIDSTDVYMPSEEWRYIVGVYDMAKLYIYADNVEVMNGNFVGFGVDVTATDLILGYLGSYWKGGFDEFRLSGTARSAAWIKASYNTENDNLLTDGAIEEHEAPTPTPPDVSNDELLGLIIAFFVIAVAVAAALVLTTRRK